MHDKFVALEREKRDRIINAAMREFSSKGFKNASTNEIVKKAGISKGALFHYFSSKRDLFDFLFRYGMNFFLNVTEPRIKEMSNDVFKRWLAFAALKIEIAAQYPDMSGFMQSAYKEESPEISGLMKNEFESFSSEFLEKIYNGIDVSKFRDETDSSRALQIIWWTLEGFAMLKQKESFDISIIGDEEFLRSLINEIESYLNMLKRAFYKEEYWE